MNYQINYAHFSRIFAVPMAVVDHYLKTAGSAQLKVLLWMLAHNELVLSTENIAQAVGLSAADTNDAINFWVENGMIQVSSRENTSSSSLPPLDSETKQTYSPTVKIMSGEMPRLRSSEIQARRQQDAQVRYLFDEAEAHLKRPVTMTDMSTLIGMHDWIGLDYDIILMIMEYATSIGKNSARNLERFGILFSQQGCTTHEKAEAFIRRLEQANQHYSLVKSAFGIGERRLISSERQHIDRWFDEFGFSIEMIRLAYERTIEATGKLSFHYINSILKSWYEKGIRCPKDVQLEQIEHQAARKKSAEKTAPSDILSKPSYDTDKFDYDSLYNLPKYKRRS